MCIRTGSDWLAKSKSREAIKKKKRIGEGRSALCMAENGVSFSQGEGLELNVSYPQLVEDTLL